jgi:peptidyl-prolyl cis-trans isomerase C
MKTRANGLLLLSLALLLILTTLAPTIGCSGDADSSEPKPATDPAATEEGSEPGAIVSQVVAADPESFPDVVAQVNDTNIKKAELLTRAKALQAQLPAAAAGESVEFYRRVLNDLVGTELLYQASKAKGFLAPDAAVENQMNTLRTRFGDQAQFEQALLAQGLTPEKLREGLTRDLTIQKFVETEIMAGVSVTDEAKRTFYQENAEQMKRPEQVRVSHILVMADQNAPAEERELARKKSQDLLARLKKGEDFATLAGENSDDPGSRANGGELPWVSRGETVPAFEQTAFALAPGEISEVVETPFGFHVIKLAERREARTLPYEEAEENIEQFLRQQAIREQVQSRVDALKAAAEVEIFI